MKDIVRVGPVFQQTKMFSNDKILNFYFQDGTYEVELYMNVLRNREHDVEVDRYFISYTINDEVSENLDLVHLATLEKDEVDTGSIDKKSIWFIFEVLNPDLLGV